MKNTVIILLLFLPALAFVNSCKPDDKTDTGKPNILFINSDDHTSQAFGVYGSWLAVLKPTPAIDRIAREGMLFENCFCTNSICTPSRACIMTGQYSQTNGVLDLNGRLSPENQHLAREMHAIGYETAMIGKWHLKELPEAFDYYNVLHWQGSYFDPVLEEIGCPDDVLMEVGSGERKRKEKGVQYEGHSSIGHRNIIRNMGMHMGVDPAIPDPEYTHLAYQEYLKRYLRCVKGVDDNVKRIFEYLEEEGNWPGKEIKRIFEFRCLKVGSSL